MFGPLAQSRREAAESDLLWPLADRCSVGVQTGRPGWLDWVGQNGHPRFDDLLVRVLPVAPQMAVGPGSAGVPVSSPVCHDVHPGLYLVGVCVVCI